MSALGRVGFLMWILATTLPVGPARAQHGPTQADLDGGASSVADWLHTNHDYGGQRFVEATEIHRENAASVRPVCRYELNDLHAFPTNPIVHRGVIYVTTPHATIAIDAVTCRAKWRYDRFSKAREGWPQNRGVAAKDGKIVRGTRDGFLLALDAETGQLLWERAVGDAEKDETFTMPPVIFEDLVIIGPAGSEVPIDGWIGAFRLENGEPVWRFRTRPAPGEPGAESWGATDALTGGGGVWTPLSLDRARGLVFVPVGNPAPDLYGDVRQGANLYTNSLVVLDARTGKLAWHYHAVPHDTHDWDLTQVSPLFATTVKGQLRRLVAVVGKDGLLRVLDRESREHLYEVPVTRRQNVDAPLTLEGVHVCPGVLGGVQWNGPAFSPRTSMLYVAAVDWCGTFRKDHTLVHSPGRNYMGGSWSADPVDESRGWLTAIDATTGVIRWRYESRRPMLAAITATSTDLLFTGELSGDFLVLDARDGTVLHRHPTGGAMIGGIVTYQIDGRQYVAVTSGTAAGFWKASRAPAALIIFALPPPESRTLPMR